MSSTSLPQSPSPSAYIPLSGQHISSIERDLVADPFSVLTRSRQDRLLMVSFVSILLAMGAVTITKDSFNLLGIPLHSEADVGYVKNIAVAAVLVFLVMFVVSVWQDFFTRHALKPGIQGRLDDTQSALTAEDLSVAKINELLSMMDKHIKLAQQPGRTQAESDLELEEDLRKIPQYMPEIRAESKTQTKKFSGAESYLTRRVKRLGITVH
jgi:hypothetical protein